MIRLLELFNDNRGISEYVFSELGKKVKAKNFISIVSAINDELKNTEEKLANLLKEKDEVVESKNKYVINGHLNDVSGYTDILSTLKKMSEIVSKVKDEEVLDFVNYFLAITSICSKEDVNDGWIKTDDFQWVKQLNAQVFEIVNVFSDDEHYYIAHEEINLSDYTIKELEDGIKPFSYKNIGYVYFLYGDATNQIIAECVSENNMYSNVIQTLTSEHEVQNHLQSEFTISEVA